MDLETTKKTIEALEVIRKLSEDITNNLELYLRLLDQIGTAESDKQRVLEMLTQHKNELEKLKEIYDLLLR